MEDKSLNQNYRWYAYFTDSRAEKKVFSELIRKGIKSYLPLKIVKRQWSDRVKNVECPLISGYIFVLVSSHEFYDVLLTPGVRRYVCFDGKPAPIPEKQIEDLKCFLQYLNSEAEVTNERITKGQLVRIVSGPLAGIDGEVVEIRGKRCILLRFSNLGFSVHAELGNENIEILSPSSTTVLISE